MTIAPFVPSPTMPYAGAQWYWNFLTELANLAEVTLVAPDLEENRSRLEACASAPWQTTLAASETRLIRMKILWRTGLNKPFMRARSGLPSFDDAFVSAISDADAVDLQWSETASLIPRIRKRWPNIPIGVTEHDVLFNAMATANLSERVFASAIRKQEIRLLNRADAVFTFKQADTELLRSHGLTCDHVEVVDPWIEIPPSFHWEERVGKLAIFVAAWDRPANVKGALWLLDSIWPLVLEAVPDACLTLAGGNPPPELYERQSSSVRVTGFVPELSGYYRAASVAISVSFTSGGVKTKVPQAMAYGLPVVATTVGAEGVTDAPDYALAVEDERTRFAQALVERLKRGGTEDEARRIHRWVRERFDPTHAASTVLEAYSGLARGSAARDHAR